MLAVYLSLLHVLYRGKTENTLEYKQIRQRVGDDGKYTMDIPRESVTEVSADLCLWFKPL